MASPLFRHYSEYGELRNGARFDQETFHRLYEDTPEQFKAELIGGVVSVLPRGSPAHGSYTAMLGGVIGIYESKVPRIDSFLNITLILGPDSEPHADLAVHFRGRVSDDDDYVRVPPDFVAEVAYTADDIELSTKKRDYERYGVREYLVLTLKPLSLACFALGSSRKFEQLVPDQESVLRSRVLPGFWVSVPGFLDQDFPRIERALLAGVAAQNPEDIAGGRRRLYSRRSES